MPCQFNLCFTDIIPQLVAVKVEGPKNNCMFAVWKQETTIWYQQSLPT